MGDEEEVERARARARTPAGLEATGRDEALVRPPEIHPSGIRGDSRSTVPGTEMPAEGEPAGQAELRRKLLRLIEGTSKPELGLDEMARQLGLSQAEAGRLIEELEDEGHLRWQGERPIAVHGRDASGRAG
jgi:hypothetical protein